MTPPPPRPFPPALSLDWWEVGWGRREASRGRVGGGCGERWGWAQKVLLRLHSLLDSIFLTLTILFLRPGDLFSHHCCLPILASFQPKFQHVSLETQAKHLRPGPCCSPRSPASCPVWAVLPGCAPQTACSPGALASLAQVFGTFLRLQAGWRPWQ